jgi:CheY-like chemotaxis protein
MAMVRITVVNDNPELLDLIGEILEGDRYATTLIHDAQEDLLRHICESKPEVLMMDLRHGDDARHRWGIVQELRRTVGCEDLPVVLCSGDTAALNELHPELEAAGSVVTLTLPFGIDELRQSILRLTGRGEAFRCS